MSTVFDVFQQTLYDHVTIRRGTVYGNRNDGGYARYGVFKLRGGMDRSGGDRETNSSSATLHIKPENMKRPLTDIGQGIRVNDVLYEIRSVTEGRNYDTNEIEHYTLSLERADLVQ